jgi:hypothetical protein
MYLPPRRRYQRKSIKDVNIDCIQSNIWGKVSAKKKFNSGLKQITFYINFDCCCMSRKPFWPSYYPFLKNIFVTFPPNCSVDLQ